MRGPPGTGPYLRNRRRPTMRSRSLTLFAFLVAAAPALPARAAEKAAPALVVRLHSLDDLVADARYLAEQAGKGDEARQLEGILKALAGPKGIEGFDTTRPIGAYARIGATVDETDFALLVPVADEKMVLAL